MKKTLLLTAAVLPFAIAHANAETSPQENLVITAKVPVEADDFAGSVTTITAEDIQLSGATNILEAIQMVPGLSVNSVSTRATGRNGVSIRGMENNHTLILVDGRRISNSDTNVPFSDFQYNWVPLVAVERIEVIRGPLSNLYGSAALGGVINIITRDADNSWNTTVETQITRTHSGEGGDAQQFSLATAGPVGDQFDLAIALETQNTDPYKKSFSDSGSSANKEGKENFNAVVKAGVDLSETDRIGLNIVHSRDDRTQYPDTPSYEIKRSQIGMEYLTEVAGFDVAANVYRSSSDNDLLSQTYVHRLSEDVATVDINGELSERHYLLAGIEYADEEYHKDYDTASSNEFRDSFSSWSAFAEDRFALTDDLTMTWGGRYDDHQRFGSALSPKVYFNWDLSDHWQLKGGYSEAFKAPAVKDASDDYYFSYTYPTAFGGPGGSPSAFLTNEFIGNSDLKEETSKSFEVGANYSDGDFSGGVTLFHNSVKDLISTDEISRVTTPAGPGMTLTTSRSRYENVANARITGLEAELGYWFTETLSAEFNVSLIDHEDEDTGKWLTNRSQVESNLSLTHEVQAWDLKSRIQVKYNGKQYIDSNNTNETPATTVVDLNLRKGLGEYAYASFGVKNLFDELAAEKDENDGTSETGRQFLLTVGATF
ncbi:MAG: TonB-dependent receptor [Amphritea sp.]|nr:TonB-dependent receptor [Amphritea sp.]